MNKKKVELPLIEPMFSTYHHHGTSTAILKSNPSIKNWVYNQAIGLGCGRSFLEGFTSPQADILISSHNDNPFIIKVPIAMKYLGEHTNSVIRSLIDDGFYVYFNEVDDYYMQGKSWYKENHAPHSGLVCGYDQEKKAFSIYAYDKDWRYRVFEMPQAAMDRGRIGALKRAKNPTLYGLKPKADKCELHVPTICMRLRDYLNSSFKKYPADIHKHPASSMNRAYGIVVHDYLALYLDRLLDGSIPYDHMDRRIFRLIWDHKSVMLGRIKAVEELLMLGCQISQKYEPLVKQAEKMRMMYAIYNRRKRDSLLVEIKKLLLDLREREAPILEEFIHKAEGAKWL